MEYFNNIENNNCVGKIYKSKNSGDFIITKYNNSRNIEIEFIETGYRKIVQIGNIRCGEVKDCYLPSVYEVGVIGSRYLTHVRMNDGERTCRKEYMTWRGMLRRCYSEKKLLDSPTYIGCTVSENFKHYEYFYEWCNRQIGFNNEGWHLDKDLLVKGNKVYSEDTCVFLPEELNILLVKRKSKRGDYPIGVHYCKSKKSFISQINRNKGQQDYLGKFNTPEEAFFAYKEAKEAFIKEQANKWKDKIDPRAFQALMTYEVDIND